MSCDNYLEDEDDLHPLHSGQIDMGEVDRSLVHLSSADHSVGPESEMGSRHRAVGLHKERKRLVVADKRSWQGHCLPLPSSCSLGDQRRAGHCPGRGGVAGRGCGTAVVFGPLVDWPRLPDGDVVGILAGMKS